MTTKTMFSSTKRLLRGWARSGALLFDKIVAGVRRPQNVSGRSIGRLHPHPGLTPGKFRTLEAGDSRLLNQCLWSPHGEKSVLHLP
jgi:hypothetical protein